jgi:NAD+ kinase
VFTDETAAAIGDGSGAPAEAVERLGADILVAFGGDGTFLRTLHRSSVPLLPVNAGTVGFLAEIDGAAPGRLEDALDRVLGGHYYLEDRMRLATQADGANLPDATNEVVIHTSQVAKMRLFEVAVDGRPVGRIRADGVIVATPTGSTSYSLSALGPIIDPAVEAIVITAIAPFQATQRAVLVDPMRLVGVRLVLPEKDGVVVVDGQSEQPVAGGAGVLVYRSPRKASFVRFGSRTFGRLRGKRILPWTETEEPPSPEDVERADLPPAA